MSTVQGGWAGPKIVRNGLVLYIDAASPNTYTHRNPTSAFDMSGNNNHGTLINGVGHDGEAFTFDGVDDYIKPPTSPIFQFTNFTITSWFKLTSLNINQYIVDTSTRITDGSGYSYRVKSDNKIRFWAYNANNALDTTTTITNDIWYYVAVTYDNTTKLQTIYLNGILNVSNIHTNTFVVSDITKLRIANSQVLGGPLNGNMSIVTIYNRALTAQEIQQNFNATRGRFGI